MAEIDEVAQRLHWKLFAKKRCHVDPLRIDRCRVDVTDRPWVTHIIYDNSTVLPIIEKLKSVGMPSFEQCHRNWIRGEMTSEQ